MKMMFFLRLCFLHNNRLFCKISINFILIQFESGFNLI